MADSSMTATSGAAGEKGKYFPSKPLSFLKKASYGGGNFAANLMVTTASSFITFFYTNVAGIPIIAAGLILLVARLFDGTTDLLMGIVVDKTRTRWGKARPWILWMCIPYAVTLWLMFTSPDIGETGKIIWAGVTYILAQGIIYTAMSVPYNSMSSLATENPDERTQLSAYRTFFGYAGALIVSTFTTQFVAMLGDTMLAWQIVAIIYGVIGAAIYFNVFLQLKEVTGNEEEVKEAAKEPLGKMIKTLLTNKYWWFTLLSIMAGFVISGLMGGVAYYAMYVLNDFSILSLLMPSSFLPIMIGSMVLAPLAHRLGKRRMALIGIGVSIIGQFICIAFATNVPGYMAGLVVRGFGTAGLMIPVFAMIGDSAEYGYLKTGVRSEGMAFSAVGFAEKVGSGLGGVILTSIMAAGGFDAELPVQSASAIDSIIMVMNYVPLVLLVISAIFIWLYRLDRILPKMVEEAKHTEQAEAQLKADEAVAIEEGETGGTDVAALQDLDDGEAARGELSELESGGKEPSGSGDRPDGEDDSGAGNRG